MENDWLKQLKAGDEVIISSRWIRRIAIVDKVTPTGRITADKIKFNQYGREIGGGHWDRYRLEQASVQEKQKVKDQDDVNKAFNEMRLASKLTPEQARKIIEILK